MTSGRGIASTARAEEISDISRLKNVTLLNGSLNLVSKLPYWFDTSYAIYSNGKGYYYWEAYIDGIPVILNRWGCPAHIFEVFSEHHLRTKLDLQDGDVITLSVPLKTIHSVENYRKKNRLIWYAIWFGREMLFYKNTSYLAFVESAFFSKYFWRSCQF